MNHEVDLGVYKIRTDLLIDEVNDINKTIINQENREENGININITTVKKDTDIKSKGKDGKLITLTIIVGGFYGFTTVFTSLKTIVIMYSFGSDFSLGIITLSFSAPPYAIIVV